MTLEYFIYRIVILVLKCLWFKQNQVSQTNTCGSGLGKICYNRIIIQYWHNKNLIIVLKMFNLNF